METKNRGIYIHVPFCKRKCTYCDFYSNSYCEREARKYADAVIRELDNNAKRFPSSIIDTIYIGGGTPSVLPYDILKKIIDRVFSNFNTDVKEFTIEVNPSSNENLNRYSDLGINRVSIGVQSLNDEILSRIGRLHNADLALKTLDLANKYFDNVSADVILGLPTQTIDDAITTVKGILPYVKHVSSYMLKINEDTPIYNDYKLRANDFPDDDLTVDIYNAVYDVLEKNGFHRYEISNFSKSGYESKHNLKYWDRGEYFGIGPSASGFLDGNRINNVSDLDAYIKLASPEIIPVSTEDAEFETIMLSFRLTKGLNIEKFNSDFNCNFLEKYSEKIHKLNDLLVIDNGYIYIKKDKLLLESLVAREFL